MFTVLPLDEALTSGILEAPPLYTNPTSHIQGDSLSVLPILICYLGRQYAVRVAELSIIVVGLHP